MDGLRFVEITTDTKTPYGQFFDGEIRKVEPEVAGFLIGNGWAKRHSITLEVQNGVLGHKAEAAG